MKKENRPNELTNAPLQYWPSNELGVVFLFANIFRKKQFRIEEIKPKFPDCIAYKRTGDGEKRVRIEFEFRSSSFKTHGHDPRKCDCIVCWHHDWPDCPKRIEVIELKREFGAAPKVWIQTTVVAKFPLDGFDKGHWSISRRASKGDLLLMYRCSPEKSINNLFVVIGEKYRGKAVWREGDCYYARIKRLCDLKSPIFFDDMRNHKVLKTSSFIRSNMRSGNCQVTEYWPYLYEIIVSRNPDARKVLHEFAPENL